MLPTLTTKRLVLRPIQSSDAEAIAALGGKDFEVARWLTGCSWPYNEGDAETFVADVMAGNPLEREAAFAMTLGGVFIGMIAIEAPGDLEQQPDCPTLGYWIGRSFQGFGYTSEAARAVLDWAFLAYDCQAIAARAYEENTASRALLRKQGFRPVGMTERFAKPLDRKVSCVVVRLERDDFEARRVAA
ncbi:GNAT family N-acetyltransferase [Labrenzia sp. CE80]|uniref:GNAT family N-acetyltransferase n=1 Tax=Labrenzia sp. CE80 TaxID=1788986 RepID=UPI00129AC217|nr:GNAT family N-acetyltransferase [Labrenzia sp. CE80]